MIRKASMAVLIFITAVLQCSVFQIFRIASIGPNLLILLTVSFGLMRGRRSGLMTGFFSGLMLDLFFPGGIESLGFYALIYMWIGYIAGGSYRIFYDDDIKTPLLLVSLGDLFYGIWCYIFTFALRGRIHFFWYLGRIIIPEILYTLVMTFVFYRLLRFINKKLSRYD